MAYLKRKRIKGRDYYYLAQSYRQAGKVRTRTLKYLGTRPHVPAEYRYLLQRGGSHAQALLWDEPTPTPPRSTP